MIKKTLLALLFSFSIIFFCCNTNLESEIVMYYIDSIPKLEHFYKYHGNKKYTYKEIRYSPTGLILVEGYYDVSGSRTGKWTSYYEDGNKWLIENYENGIKNGKIIEWYKSGKKMYEGIYKNNLPHGKWTIYDESGKRISKFRYQNGKSIE